VIPIRRALALLLLLSPLALTPGCASAQQPAGTVQPAAVPAPSSEHTRSLSTTTLAGQQIVVLPLTLMAAEPALEADTLYAPYRDRRAAFSWADSLLGDVLTGRAPEVRWVLPPALRKAARRGAGFVADPDQMGQSILRAPKLKKVPDPLRSSLRNLVAVAGGRYALVPAALGFTRDSAGQVQADLAIVVADARNGEVLWRSQAKGAGSTPRAAYSAALGTILPAEAGTP
jgi:hypothetical protein